MTQRALLVVDYSYDFIAEDGKLTCGEAGQRIESFIVQRVQDYIANDDNVFFLMDLHEENDPYHPETKLFPPHNIIGTPGRELYGEVKELYETIQPKNNVHFINKRRYDSFYGTPLDALLRERNIDTVEILGVCTDICVLHTAVSAYNLGYHLIIPTAGVASFNQIGHEWALSHFKDTLGAKVE
ncbi:cysteine hydrolase [Staphylococcus muscae]|uniref:Isochorismatase n=1 Tax=Staphylococcus muscae TaxID=1294 RepID=A0A240C621_9STAP|nr:isochorismatase family cysteine hydrolase [Staphylococcus muscae]AVQ33431.1 cysteine hydrolase [Staphylococcus muscae]PNZ04331.1 cysteine hydrolase [Staphylococcus muscae]GGA90115.1 isochorismatase [Staphylococcus muscae]SNW03239.1 isochorismatase family protein [Staphylococcus muscae]